MIKKLAKIPAKEPAKKLENVKPGAVRDDGEDVVLMEPMRISEESNARLELTELVFELAKRSTAFRASLPRGLAEPLAEFVRSMVSSCKSRFLGFLLKSLLSARSISTGCVLWPSIRLL